MARKKQTKYDYDQLPEQRPGESDATYYKRLVKTANERMRQIEKLANDPIYGEMKHYAYKNAMYDLKHIYKTDEGRFKTKLPKTKEGDINRTAFHQQMNAVKKFLEAPTSTRRGVLEVYKKRADTINKKYGKDNKDWKNLSWKDLANYYQSDQAAINAAEYGSDTVVRALGAIKRISNDPDRIRKASEGNIRLSKDDTVNEIARNLLENGITF